MTTTEFTLRGRGLTEIRRWRDVDGDGGPVLQIQNDRVAADEARANVQRPRHRGDGAVTPRSLGILTGLSLVWAAYLLFHVAGAVHLFGRP